MRLYLFDYTSIGPAVSRTAKLGRDRRIAKLLGNRLKESTIHRRRTLLDVPGTVSAWRSFLVFARLAHIPAPRSSNLWFIDISIERSGMSEIIQTRNKIDHVSSQRIVLGDHVGVPESLDERFRSSGYLE